MGGDAPRSSLLGQDVVGRSGGQEVAVASARSCVSISLLDGGTAPLRVQVTADAATA
jgi:hypothetical protein